MNAGKTRRQARAKAARREATEMSARRAGAGGGDRLVNSAPSPYCHSVASTGSAQTRNDMERT